MAGKLIPLILLIVGAICQWPSMSAASTGPADLALQAWLTSISPMDDPVAGTEPDDRLSDVARFYREINFQTAWTRPDGLLPSGEILLQAFAHAPEAGLLQADYVPAAPFRTIGAAPGNVVKANSQAALAPHVQADLLITASVLRYARHLSMGQVSPARLPAPWRARPREISTDIPVELAQALHNDRLAAFIESLHPQGQTYQHLFKALRRYKDIQRRGGWPVIGPGPILRQGDAGSRVNALRHRLIMTGDLHATSTDPGVFDPALKTAVIHFQKRHGMSPDGLVGRQTLSELNITVAERITQLLINMERSRWLPDHLGDRYLMVNIPAFELDVIESGRRVATMKAIVGRRNRQTPVFSGRMTFMELNPFWNIPRRIASRDILPKARNNPSYLTQSGIRILDGWDPSASEIDPLGIEWETLSLNRFPYRLRQDPSSRNALGQVKFIFPNSYSVFIHDTAQKSLFGRQERHLSSGCIRVEKPLRLAQHLLADQGWNGDRLTAAIARGQRRVVLLDTPVPVHLVYFTAWVDDDGSVNFRKDIYGRDAQLLAALRQGASRTLFCDVSGKDQPSAPTPWQIGAYRAANEPTAGLPQRCKNRRGPEPRVKS